MSIKLWSENMHEYLCVCCYCCRIDLVLLIQWSTYLTYPQDLTLTGEFHADEIPCTVVGRKAFTVDGLSRCQE